MDLAPLRALALDLNLTAHGVDVTVTPTGGAAVETRGLWETPSTEAAGFDLRRQEARRVLVLARAAVASAPRGSIVLAPDRTGGTVLRWRIDGVDRAEDEVLRVFVVRDAEDVFD